MPFKANFSIAFDVWEAFKKKASSEGQTAAAVLNQLVRSYLEGPPNTNIRELVKSEVQMQVKKEIEKIAAKIQSQSPNSLSAQEQKMWAEYKSAQCQRKSRGRGE